MGNESLQLGRVLAAGGALDPARNVNGERANRPHGSLDVLGIEPTRQDETARRQPTQHVPGEGAARAPVHPLAVGVEEEVVRGATEHIGRQVSATQAKSAYHFYLPSPNVILRLVPVKLERIQPQ